MKTIKHYLILYPKYVAMALKTRLAYRVDMFFGILGFIISNSAIFLTMVLTLAPVSSVAGWDINMIMFLYGFTLIPKGIDHILTDNIWALGNNLVRDGELDKYLTKPTNVLFQLIASEFQCEGFGELILGTAFMAAYGPHLVVTWNVNNTLPLILITLVGTLIFTSIKLFTASFAFFFKRSSSFMNGIYQICDYAKYPIKVFGSVIENILLWVIPFGLIGYLPIQLLFFPDSSWFNGNMWILLAVIAAVTAGFFSLSILMFKIGLKHYESSGT